MKYSFQEFLEDAVVEGEKMFTYAFNTKEKVKRARELFNEWLAEHDKEVDAEAVADFKKNCPRCRMNERADAVAEHVNNDPDAETIRRRAYDKGSDPAAGAGEAMTYKPEHLVCTTQYCNYRKERCDYISLKFYYLNQQGVHEFDMRCTKYTGTYLTTSLKGKTSRCSKCKMEHPGALF